MATFFFVVYTVTVLVATSSAAPQKSKYHFELPDECMEDGFCNVKPEGFEAIEARINELLQKELTNLEDRNAFGFRFSSPAAETDDDNCPSKNITEYPVINKSGKNIDVIVNTLLYPQPIHKVVCEYEKIKNGQRDGNADQQCFTKLKLRNLDLKSRCQERSVTRTLRVFDIVTGGIVTKNYTIPAGCSCLISHNI